MDTEELKKIIEAILFTNHNPVLIEELRRVFPDAGLSEISDAVTELQDTFKSPDRGICITAVAGGYQMCTKGELAQWVKKFYQIERKEKLSRPSLETLAIIAYKQPVTRPEIESIRGVSVDYILKKLLHMELVRIMGRKKTVGAPFVYGTTDKFLSYFGLSTLSELPKVENLAMGAE